MTGFIPNDGQAAAMRGAKAWYRERRQKQQCFFMTGPAGSGKTETIKHAVAEMGIGDAEGAVPVVLYATYTAKAALVLQRRGVPCCTIHSLIYNYCPVSEGQIAATEARIAELLKMLPKLGGAERQSAERQIRERRSALVEMKKPRFLLNPQSILRDAKLLVLDEISMVDEDMAADILGFGKPVLVIGDLDQLPPPKGRGAFINREPDVRLTEIHRQAADSAVIRIATMARLGQPIPSGRHDEYVWKLPRNTVSPAEMLHGDQVIVGFHATRLALNNAMRRAKLADPGDLPVGPDDKVICLRNDHSQGLINGQFLELSNVEPVDDVRFTAEVVTEDSVNLGETVCYAGHFLDHVALDRGREERDRLVRRTMVEADFGYAITCHKAQGSGFRNVIVVDDGWGRSPIDRNRWLYTACSRAEQGLVVLG